MHDAGWRSSFGGTLYKNGGSHGCINLPPAAAKTIYENISAGMPVLCYHLEGTERGSAAAVPAETTAAAETAAPVETPAAQPESPSDPQETPEETPEAPTQAPVPPVETTAASAASSAAETEASPAETTARSTESYGPGGAPAKPDTGAVAGPGM